MPELHGKSWSRAELSRRVGRLEQVAGIRLVTLGDGVERGVRVLEFRTGTGFEFDVVVDRAFDIGRCEHAGRALAWTSGTGFAGPWFYEPEGLGFFRSFGGGLLTTCGLDHALFMAEDTAEQYHYPPKPTETFGLHGRVSNRPARLVGYGERWEGDECLLYADGEVLQAAVFGEQLLLRRRIEAPCGRVAALRSMTRSSMSGTIVRRTCSCTTSTSAGPSSTTAPSCSFRRAAVEPRGDHAVEAYRIIGAPTRGYVEQVFEHELAAEADGHVPVAIVNRRLGLGAYQLFRHDQLPNHFVWKMLGEGTYVIGIEPCTNRTAGRLDARARGELIELEPGESRMYELELGALVGRAAIDAFAARVEAPTS